MLSVESRRGGRAEDLVHRELEIGKRRGCYVLAAATAELIAIAVGGRIAEDIDGVRSAIDDPHFDDARPCVERQLTPAVVAERGVRDLNDQERICRRRMRGAVEVVAPLQQHHVGLGLRMPVDGFRLRTTTAPAFGPLASSLWT